jgi:glycosyltransferase involved in cell wall biosynthesis
MARLLMRALSRAGFEPALASTLRTLDLTGDPNAQDRLKAQSEAAAARLVDQFHAVPASRRPRLWFTYHVYYKAPDWIGPRVADALRIPYVVAEGSRAAKRASGPWAAAHRGAEAALDRADVVFVMTDHDREALERAKPAMQRLIDLPPFIDEHPGIGETRAVNSARESPNGRPRLLAVAMMRRGDKFASYCLLANALATLQPMDWTLDIVGDGEARGEVERLFAPFGGRVRFYGAVADKAELRKLYRQADLLIWPAVNEAYGMVLLEAQAEGCPVVAGRYGGVASVVIDGSTGLLTPAGDAAAFATAVATLLTQEGKRRRLGECARIFVRDERSMTRAAARLRAALMPLIGEGA